MLQSLFRNLQPVVKNLLIINLLFFLASIVFLKQGFDLNRVLGLFYVGSSDFQPYQLATHFFMHAGARHIIFNMFGLLAFGNMLERVWGAKRFLLFYFGTALGAAFLHQFIQGIEIFQATGEFFPNLDRLFRISDGFVHYNETVNTDLITPFLKMHVPVVGASGAIFGLLMGAAMYFPNTEMLLYFAFKVKIKWLALGAGVYELWSIIQDNPLDSVAHFAHLGGALFGFIFIKLWQRNQSKFY